jgi:cation:H+ antiporter
VIAIDDIAFTKGPILAHVSRAHAASALSAMVMSAVAVIALLYRPRTRLFRTVGWASLTLLVIYLLNAYVLFLYGD